MGQGMTPDPLAALNVLSARSEPRCSVFHNNSRLPRQELWAPSGQFTGHCARCSGARSDPAVRPRPAPAESDGEPLVGHGSSALQRTHKAERDSGQARPAGPSHGGPAAPSARGPAPLTPPVPPHLRAGAAGARPGSA